MTIRPSSDNTERNLLGIAAWLDIPRNEFDAARSLTVPDKLQRTIVTATSHCFADTVEVSVPLSSQEVALLNAQGI